MKGVQYSRVKGNEENYRTSKCHCPGNQDYSKRNSRTPLADIQDPGEDRRYVEDYGFKKNVCSPSSFKESARSRHQILESTRISNAPSIKESLLPIPPTVSVRTLQKGEMQKLIAQAGMTTKAAKSGSCRCPGNESSISSVKDISRRSSKYYGESSDTERTLNALVSTKVRTHSNSPAMSRISTSSHSLLNRDSSRYTYDNQTQLGISQRKGCCSSVKRDKTSPATFKVQSDIYIDDTNLRSISSKSNTSSGSGSARRVSSIESSRQQYNRSSRTSSTTQTSLSSTRSSFDSIASSSSTYSSSKATVISSGKAQTSKSVSKTENSSNKLFTLPSQHFVTLSQDTLHSTASMSASFDSRTSALSRVKAVRDSSIIPDDEFTFVDSESFFQDLEQGKSSTLKTIPICSPPSLNIPVRRGSISATQESTKRPAVKSTLKKKCNISEASPHLLHREVRHCTDFVLKFSSKLLLKFSETIYFPLLYCPEYIEDLLAYSYKNNNCLLKQEWLEAYIDKRYRTFTVNWLLQVTAIIIPHFDPIYFMSVRIFDYTIIKLKLRKSYYQLAAIIALWISVKYLESSVVLKTPKIYSICNGHYSKEQILSMEKNVFKSLNFCLNISDPLDYLYNYLKSSNLENNELLKNGSKFVLECATLFENFPLAKAPFIAAGALYLAYSVVLKTNDVFINFVWFERKMIEKYAKTVLTVNVKYVIMEKYEPFTKYITPQKLHVAQEFLNI